MYLTGRIIVNPALPQKLSRLEDKRANLIFGKMDRELMKGKVVYL